MSQIYKEELIATLNQFTDQDDDDVGTFNTFRQTATRGSDAQFALYFGEHGNIKDANGESIHIRHGYIEGLTIRETMAHCARSRAAISGVNQEMAGLDVERALSGRSFGVITRARRSDRPGVVFARAAARGEVDPLKDVDARILCGLPVS